VSIDGLIPKICNRDAHEERAAKCPNAVDREDTDHDITKALNITLGENSHILEDNRYLGKDQG
jgi:hypothetical protein